jgi:hypothetical protein
MTRKISSFFEGPEPYEPDAVDRAVVLAGRLRDGLERLPRAQHRHPLPDTLQATARDLIDALDLILDPDAVA